MKQRTGLYPCVQVDAAGSGVVSQAGGVTLLQTVRASGLDLALRDAVARWRRPTAVHDPAKVDELWSPAVAGWFPDGKDDPTVALIRVEAETVELWATDEPRPVVLFKVLKAAVTGGQPDIGEYRTVSFE